jgi:ubiquinone/menaquinone biosynthesis C-methylase UbiE
MIAPTPPGDALDAACGTGRHAATLVEFGHRVVGVDTTEAMLAIARKKVPSADFRSGRLEQLPVEDETTDLITCALALTHVERLEPVMREFARVLRPGGQAILTDIHPVATMTRGIAGFRVFRSKICTGRIKFRMSLGFVQKFNHLLWC